MPSPVHLGPYELLRRVARGGMGEVWHARHRSLGHEAAIKVLGGDPVSARVEALEHEIHALASLDHPHVVAVYDRGWVDEAEAFASFGQVAAGSPWMALEWAGDGTLLDRRASLDWPALHRILTELLAALSHTHAHGVVHRDIKPGNVLFGGRGRRVKLADFGLARTPDRRAADGGAGTPAYMAPEQFAGDESVQGPWTDLYQLGVVAWACATGALPFPGDAWDVLEAAHVGEQPPSFVPRFPVPVRLGAWLGKLLRKDPSRRFRFAADAQRALGRLGPVEAAGKNPTIVAMDVTAQGVTSGSDDGGVHRSIALVGLRPIPLIGRRTARNTLWGLLREVHAERAPRVAVLEGPSGTGKTRLARWLATHAHEVGAADYVWATHADVPGTEDGVVGLVARVLGVTALPADEARTRIQDRWHEDPVEGAALAALVAPGPDDRFSTPSERYELTLRVLRRLAFDRPVVVVLDDAQWGVDALGLVEHVLTHDRRLPLLFVVTVQTETVLERPVALGKLRALRSRGITTVVQVGPMDLRYRRRFLVDGLGLAPALATRLEERVAGNASFAVELVRDWAARGLLRETSWGLDLEPSADPDLPRSLHEVWGRRLDAALVGWSDASLQTLELAALLGVEVDVDEWADACWVAGVNLPHAVAPALRERRLLRPVDGGWRFVHAMLREVVLQRCRQANRARGLHAACARVLRDRPGRDVVLRQARHLQAAGDAQGAAPLLLESAQHLGRQGRLRDAEAALGEWRRAMELCGVDLHNPAWVPGWVALSGNLRGQGRMEEAGLWAERAERVAVDAGDELDRAQSARAVGLVQWDLGELSKARDRLKEAVELATLAGEPSAIADAATSFGLITMAQGDLLAGIRALELVLGMCREHDDPWIETQALLGLVYAAIQQERFDDAVPLLERAEQLARGTNARADVAYCAEMHGELLRGRGDPAAAEPYYREAWHEYERLGAQSAPNARVNLGLCVAELGRWADARRHFRAVAEQDLPDPGPVLRATAHLGLCACRDDADRWSEHWHAAMAMVGSGEFVARDLAALAELVAQRALEAGRSDQADRGWAFAAEQWARAGFDERARIARDRSG